MLQHLSIVLYFFIIKSYVVYEEFLLQNEMRCGGSTDSNQNGFKPETADLCPTLNGSSIFQPFSSIPSMALVIWKNVRQ